MKIAIVEDEIEHQNVLVSFLHRYENEHSISFEMDTFSNGLDLIEKYNPIYQILFLDIEMPYIDGIHIAQKVREKDTNCSIIFVTHSQKYAISGYEVNAAFYLLKPINYIDFSFKLDHVIETQREREDRKFVFETNSEMIVFLINEIKYFEVSKHKVMIHSTKGNFVIWNNSLKALETQFSPYGFSKCHASYLVNLNYVQGIKSESIDVGHDIIPLSRKFRKPFQNSLLTYWSR